MGCGGGTRASTEVSGLEATQIASRRPDLPRRDGAAGSRSLPRTRPRSPLSARAVARCIRRRRSDRQSHGARRRPPSSLGLGDVRRSRGEARAKESPRRGERKGRLSSRAPRWRATVNVRPSIPSSNRWRLPRSSRRKPTLPAASRWRRRPTPNELALAWVGKDAGVGQVFLTQLSRSGRKAGPEDVDPRQGRLL